jgi:alkanesulfonate monooxygenase SsuD/methylene tetrahydromethanopterin reductase-like flavin-dependent oxidoreductase (luciferase family)
VAFGLGGIDEDDLVGRSPNEDAVSLADVEHVDTKITSEDRADKREEHHHVSLAPRAAGYERRINSLRRRDNLRPTFYKLPNPTLREVAAREATKETFQVRGTYDEIAERLIKVHKEVGCDGFLLRANYLTKALSGYVVEFVDNVVPILQKRGYMQTGYQPGTLRERLGTRHQK